VIDEVFISNKETNESSIETIEQSPDFVMLPDLNALLPIENLTLIDDSEMDPAHNERATMHDTATV
jgi:hypothetical protein